MKKLILIIFLIFLSSSLKGQETWLFIDTTGGIVKLVETGIYHPLPIQFRIIDKDTSLSPFLIWEDKINRSIPIKIYK